MSGHDHINELFRDLLNAMCKGPDLRPCAGCSSPYCGAGKCRFEDTEALSRPAENDARYEPAK